MLSNFVASTKSKMTNFGKSITFPGKWVYDGHRGLFSYLVISVNKDLKLECSD